MNVYEKLNAARLYFMSNGAKKSGHNDFAKYDYFELGDILPIVNRAAQEIGFCVVVKFGQEEATLEFIDTAKPEERVVFTSPMSTAELKNNHAVQNLGAVETYIRRYLYLTAFEIVEADELDATQGNKKQTPPNSKPATGASEEGLEMKRILEQSAYPSGNPVFTEKDKEYWRSALKQYGGESALIMLKKQLQERLAGRSGA